VIFTSDHGDYLGQYGLFLKHPNLPYDALARVPLIVRSPSTPPEGRGARSPAPVSLMDLLPTALAANGVALPDYVQGRPLGDLLADPTRTRENPVFIETGPYRAVRSARFKYLHAGGGTVGGDGGGRSGAPRGELYDVLDDPYEPRDLGAELPGVAEEHRRLLLDWAIACAWDRYRHETWELDEGREPA